MHYLGKVYLKKKTSILKFELRILTPGGTQVPYRSPVNIGFVQLHSGKSPIKEIQAKHDTEAPQCASRLIDAST